MAGLTLGAGCLENVYAPPGNQYKAVISMLVLNSSSLDNETDPNSCQWTLDGQWSIVHEVLGLDKDIPVSESTLVLQIVIIIIH